MQVTEASSARLFEGGNSRARNIVSKVMLLGREGSRNNYMMGLTHCDDPNATPRHRHNFEQTRMTLGGSFEYAKGQTIDPGQVMYFPESVHYGPQIRRNCTVITTQFGGASGAGFMSENQRRDGMAALEKKGTFEKGWYTWTDESGRKHNRDSIEAIWEQVMGAPVAYPPARYNDLVLMSPENYAWTEAPDEPGVARKLLGCFTERELTISFIRLDHGAEITLDARHAPELLFLLSGAVTCRDRRVEAQAAFGIEASDGAVTIRAEEPATLYAQSLHKF